MGCTYRKYDQEVTKITHDDINKELLEGINIKHSDLNEDVIVTKSEKYLKEEDRKKEELEKEEPKLAEKRAKDLALNHKILPDEVVFSDDEEDMAFYKECFDSEIVPGLKKKLFEHFSSF